MPTTMNLAFALLEKKSNWIITLSVLLYTELNDHAVRDTLNQAGHSNLAQDWSMKLVQFNIHSFIYYHTFHVQAVLMSLLVIKNIPRWSQIQMRPARNGSWLHWGVSQRRTIKLQKPGSQTSSIVFVSIHSWFRKWSVVDSRQKSKELWTACKQNTMDYNLRSIIFPSSVAIF